MATGVSQFAILSLRDNPYLAQRQLSTYTATNSSSAILTSPEIGEQQKLLAEAVYSILNEKPSVKIYEAALPILNEIKEVKPQPAPKPAVKAKQANKAAVTPATKKEETKAAAQAPAEQGKATSKIKAEYARPLYARPLPTGTGVITSRYGKRTLGGKTRLHAGIDIAVPKGTSIYAAKSGEVIRAGWGNGYGLIIELKHSDGSITKYAHCSKLLMKVGDKVEQGKEIAKAGSTGKSTGSHLHFEIVKNGKTINPYSHVKW